MTGTRPRRHRPSGEPPDAARQQEGSENTQYLGGRRLPDYGIVVAASPWVKERFPAARANLWDALQVGKDRDPHPEPEPDLEAEP